MIEKIIDIIKKYIKNIDVTKIRDNKGNEFFYISRIEKQKDMKLEDLFEALNIYNVISDITVDDETYRKLEIIINKIINEESKKKIRNSCDNRCIGL